MADRPSRAKYMKCYRESKRHLKQLEQLVEDATPILVHPEDDPVLENNSDMDNSDHAIAGEQTSNNNSDVDISDSLSNMSEDIEYLSESDITVENFENVHSSDDNVASDNSSDDDTFVSVTQQQKTKDFLCEWAIANKPSVGAMNKLLRHINKIMPMVPKTSVALKETVFSKGVVQLCGGLYKYLGLGQAIDEYLRVSPNPESFNVIINIDGVRCYRSRKKSFWPILAIINESTPFLVGVWYGVSKPSDVDLYLSDFIEDVASLQRDGYKSIAVHLVAFVCDSPARSLLKCTIGHSGYFSCERCITKGVYDHGIRMVDINAPLRTDDEFGQFSYESHQRKLSPICRLGFPMVSGFVLDPMHLVFLGVVKKLISIWISQLSRTVRDGISAELEAVAQYTPSQFQRKPRGLDCFDLWKAVEFRFFILY